MLRHYNDYCLEDKKTVTTPGTCRVTRGTGSVRGNAETPGFKMHDTTGFVSDNKNTRHYQIRRKNQNDLSNTEECFYKVGVATVTSDCYCIILI